jgi:ribosomal protein S18 acetylase RimI-like enzyme
MPQVEIRPIEKSDLNDLVQIEHSYQSQYVWQMDRVGEDGEINIHFRHTRLPRPLTVEDHGAHPLINEENWARYQAVLVAVLDKVPIGYVGLSDHVSPQTVWVTDLAVRADLRRQGIGTALLLAAQEWGAENGLRRVVFEIASKNHPAIQLARRLNFEFCGYNDYSSANQDIVLFFARSLMPRSTR